MRVARELKPGTVVNLGIGMPTLVGTHVPPEAGILLQAENGILGYGGFSEGAVRPGLESTRRANRSI